MDDELIDALKTIQYKKLDMYWFRRTDVEDDRILNLV